VFRTRARKKKKEKENNIVNRVSHSSENIDIFVLIIIIAGRKLDECPKSVFNQVAEGREIAYATRALYFTTFATR